jgi:hypothetical protein
VGGDNSRGPKLIRGSGPPGGIGSVDGSVDGASALGWADGRVIERHGTRRRGTREATPGHGTIEELSVAADAVAHGAEVREVHHRPAHRHAHTPVSASWYAS